MDDSAENNFAKLEDTEFGQCLVLMSSGSDEDGNSGPVVMTRIDRAGIEVAVTHGPWPDDEDGRDAATGFFTSLDPQNEARTLAAMIDGIVEQLDS